ncbi:MAG: GNAT family N-acetyltransferase [Burkholderiaceae bacterium]
MDLILNVPAVARLLPLVQSHGRALGALAGFEGARLRAIELAFEEAFALIQERAGPGAVEPVLIEATLDALALTVRFDDRAIPPAIVEGAALGLGESGDPDSSDAALQEISLDDVSRRLIRAAADEASWVPLGRGGNRLEMRFLRPSAAVDLLDDETALAPFVEDAPLAPEQNYRIRIAGEGPRAAQDWPAIARAMYKTYGFSYAREDFYIPERIRALNEAGLVLSVVAESELTGEVVGHYALEVSGFGQFGVRTPMIGELGKAVVDPAHRGRGLMERMRRFTEDTARARGMLALFSEPTMIHPYSQKANESLGARACAVLLGLFRIEDNRMRAIRTAAQQQRGSLLMYYQPLQPPALRRLVFPPRHRAMLERTYQGCDIPFELLPESALAPMSQNTRLEARFVAGTDIGQIHVHGVGEDVVLALRAARDQLVRRAGSPVILMQLRLDDPGISAACEAAEHLGFFYSGMCPLHADGQDVLQLQYVEVDMDLGKLAVAGPFARELLDYVAAERVRIDAR